MKKAEKEIAIIVTYNRKDSLSKCIATQLAKCRMYLMQI